MKKKHSIKIEIDEYFLNKIKCISPKPNVSISNEKQTQYL